jgi:LacI family transcriptional regulator
MSLTIDDIARAARVSTATVSRVINKNYPVSARTRKRVEAAVARLNYSPNVFARGLMKARTDSVGIIVPFLSNPYHTQIVNAIESQLSRHDVFIYLCCSYEDPDMEREYLRRLVARSVDVLIVIEAYSMNTRRNHFLDAAVRQPIILVNEHLALDAPHAIVRCAQEPGLLRAFESLHASGSRSIVLFRGGAGYSFDMKERLFKSFRRGKDLDPEQNPVVRIQKANVPQAVHEAADRIGALLKGPRPPSAVLAGNDLMAIGVLQGALAAGARVPGDLSIISVDNTMISEISSPRLSAVDLKMEKVGLAAARTYLDLREHGFQAAAPIRHTIESELIQRETS